MQGSTRTSKPEDARTGAGENAGRTRHTLMAVQCRAGSDAVRRRSMPPASWPCLRAAAVCTGGPRPRLLVGRALDGGQGRCTCAVAL